jgi:hypothetical protein
VSFDWRGVRMCPTSLSLPVWLISIPLRVIPIKLLNPNPNLPGAIASRILGEVLATATPGTWLWGFPGRAKLAFGVNANLNLTSMLLHEYTCFSAFKVAPVCLDVNGTCDLYKMGLFAVILCIFGLISLGLVGLTPADQAIMQTTVFPTLISGASSPIILQSKANITGNCRCIQDDGCWPTLSDWNLLNSTIGGRLIATRLLADVCHDPHYNDSTCNDLKVAWDTDVTQ